MRQDIAAYIRYYNLERLHSAYSQASARTNTNHT
jgi:hypothetical protein